MSTLLYFYDMGGVVKEVLLKRYFSRDPVCGGAHCALATYWSKKKNKDL